LDHIARRATGGEIVGEKGTLRKDAYISAHGGVKEALFIDPQSSLFERDYKKLPDFVAYDQIIKRVRRSETVAVMTGCVRVEPSWLPALAQGSPLLTLGSPMESPMPEYDAVSDGIMCYVSTRFGVHGWELAPHKVTMEEALERAGKDSVGLMRDDNYRWFARFLLEGKILTGLKELPLNESAAVISKRKALPKIGLLISELTSNDCDTKAKLVTLLKKDDKFLWSVAKMWAPKDDGKKEAFKKVWGTAVKKVVGKSGRQ